MSDIGVGSLVECLTSDWLLKRDGLNTPLSGRVYRVRDVVGIESRPGRVYLRLCEVRNPKVSWIDGFYEPAFSARWFRPIRDESLDVFRKAVKPVDETVDA
jgi:hypothetical protein